MRALKLLHVIEIILASWHLFLGLSGSHKISKEQTTLKRYLSIPLSVTLTRTTLKRYLSNPMSPRQQVETHSCRLRATTGYNWLRSNPRKSELCFHSLNHQFNFFRNFTMPSSFTNHHSHDNTSWQLCFQSQTHHIPAPHPRIAQSTAVKYLLTAKR